MFLKMCGVIKIFNYKSLENALKCFNITDDYHSNGDK